MPERFCSTSTSSLRVHCWSVDSGPSISERFDPRTAKRTIGRIAAGGAFGGILGGALTERVAAMAGITATLPLLAVLHLAAAAGLRFLTYTAAESRPFETASTRAGARTLRETRYLQNLALLVFLVTLSGTLIDFVLKAAAAAEYRNPEMLLRFFAAFYTGIGLVTFVVQTSLSRLSLERWGLAGTAATLPLAVLARRRRGRACCRTWPTSPPCAAWKPSSETRCFARRTSSSTRRFPRATNAAQNR